VPLHNGHYRYQLPRITWNDIQNEVKFHGRTFWIKFSEIDFSLMEEDKASGARRRLAGNDPEPPIGTPDIRAYWGDTAGCCKDHLPGQTRLVALLESGTC